MLRSCQSGPILSVPFFRAHPTFLIFPHNSIIFNCLHLLTLKNISYRTQWWKTSVFFKKFFGKWRLFYELVIKHCIKPSYPPLKGGVVLVYIRLGLNFVKLSCSLMNTFVVCVWQGLKENFPPEKWDELYGFQYTSKHVDHPC